VLVTWCGSKSKFDGSIDELDEEGKEKTQNVPGETLFLYPQTYAKLVGDSQYMT
jgi:hypothetical protein